MVLTTYQSACSAEQDRVAIKKLGVGYAIFDEGHMLKNMNTNRYQQLMKIGARRRILLTGTPLQNNLLGWYTKVVRVSKRYKRRSGIHQ